MGVIEGRNKSPFLIIRQRIKVRIKKLKIGYPIFMFFQIIVAVTIKQEVKFIFDKILTKEIFALINWQRGKLNLPVSTRNE